MLALALSVLSCTWGRTQETRSFKPIATGLWGKRAKRSDQKQPTRLQKIGHASYPRLSASLKYLDHDRERERPVYFQWQILDWSLPEDRRKLLGLELQGATLPATQLSKPPEPRPARGDLVVVEAPARVQASGGTTSQFRSRKNVDYSVKDADDRRLGNAGELAVLAEEKKFLETIGRADLAEKVVHVSEVEGDGAGYDIKSFNSEGSVRYIEVKTTKEGSSTPFFMAINEVNFSERNPEQYALYRVFEFKMDQGSGKVFKIAGNIKDILQFEPINFRVKI